MAVKLIKLLHREDFGHEWHVQVLFTDHWALFQGSLLWNDFPSWPYIQIKSGTGSLLSIIASVHKLGFDVGFIERTWKWDRIDELDNDPDFIKMEEC